MLYLLAALGETITLVAVVTAIVFCVLGFRNPFRPAWMKRAGIDNLAAMGIAAALAFVIGFEISGLAAAGLPAAYAMAFTIALVIGTAFAVIRLLGVGERLRRADAGESPFYGIREAVRGRRSGRRHA
jgi:hypothetical protein